MSTNVDQQTLPRMTRRQEEEKAQRRRREDLGAGRLRNLAVTGRQDPNYVYRWVNDDPGRVHQLTTLDDWDPVNSSELEPNAKDKGVGSVVERVGDKTTGKRVILMRKRKDYYEADKAKEQQAVDATEDTIRHGGSLGSQGLQATEGSKAYVPHGGIVINSPKT